MSFVSCVSVSVADRGSCLYVSQDGACIFIKSYILLDCAAAPSHMLASVHAYETHTLFIPVHMVPLPSYPSLHTHWKLAGMFTQSALSLQLSWLRAHSSMSAQEYMQRAIETSDDVWLHIYIPLHTPPTS